MKSGNLGISANATSPSKDGTVTLAETEVSYKKGTIHFRIVPNRPDQTT
ncbi:MAG TPA: hypothetical protein VEX13_03390 [Chloroflexia bacterium]|nr:hypothetical protein [Chloroflexia bacterium]